MNKPHRRPSATAQNPLETYLREINETALLTANQEKELSYRIADSDKEARDQMVRANLRLVVNIARIGGPGGEPIHRATEEIYMLTMIHRAMAAKKSDEGASAVEYGLLVAAIAALIVVIVFALGGVVREVFSKTCSSVKSGASTTANC